MPLDRRPAAPLAFVVSLALGWLPTLFPAHAQAPPGSESEGPPEARPVEVAGIVNVFRLGPGLWSGAQPEGAEGFESLRKLGIKTVLTVDGAPPDVEEAWRFGLRYVHLPVGYDGISRDQAIRIVEAARTLPGPVFVHCHHGQHRGPAAAALCAIAIEGWSGDRAVSWMKRAGTAPEYQGLFATVTGFRPPSAEESARARGDFPERTEPPALVDLMVTIDGRWDRLKAIRAAGYKAPENLPDADPAHEALQLVEHFRELARLPEVGERGEGFAREVASTETLAQALEAGLRDFTKAPTAEARERVERAFLAAGKACTRCHVTHRN